MNTADANCPQCKGTGILESSTPFQGFPPVITCKCAYILDLKANAERIWPGTSKAPKLPKPTPLSKFADKNLWVTSPVEGFRSHLKEVAYRNGSSWYAKVITDADILDVWLRPIKVAGEEIFDADVSETGVSKEREIADLVMPPKLLIIRVGVKVSRNNATAENFLDALQRREHYGKPTWVFDQPKWPLKGNSDHLCWSPQVEAYLSDWEHINLDAPTTVNTTSGTAAKTVQSGKRRSISDGSK